MEPKYILVYNYRSSTSYPYHIRERSIFTSGIMERPHSSYPTLQHALDKLIELTNGKDVLLACAGQIDETFTL